MSASDLFTKHFGDVCAVGTNHPNITPFFDELSQVCLQESLDEGKEVFHCSNCQKLFADWYNEGFQQGDFCKTCKK